MDPVHMITALRKSDTCSLSSTKVTLRAEKPPHSTVFLSAVFGLLAP